MHPLQDGRCWFYIYVFIVSFICQPAAPDCRFVSSHGSFRCLSVRLVLIHPSANGMIWQPAFKAIRPSPCMCHMDYCWTTYGPHGAAPFRPSRSRSRRAALVALLLLASGNVEVNPGSPQKHLVTFRSLNIWLGVKRAAVLHDVISDRQLDGLAIQESWIPSDAPATVKNDIAPIAYTALHVHRERRPDGPKRGGLAVVHRNSLALWDFSLPTGSIQPKALEMQLVCITSLNLCSVVLANIYRPPRCPIPDLADVVTSIYTASNDRLVLCGDIHYPGVDGIRVYDSLASFLTHTD